MKKLNFKILILLVIMFSIGFVACKQKMGLFPPIVSGEALTSNRKPTFTWEQSVGNPGATYYMVQLIKKVGSVAVMDPVRVNSTDALTFTPPVDLENGEYTFIVTAYKPGEKKGAPDVSSADSKFIFVIDIQSSAGIPEVVCQQGTLISATKPSFVWKKLESAALYSFTLKNKTTGSVVLDSGSVNATTRYYKQETDLPDATYEFYVYSITSMGIKSEPGICTFTIDTKGAGAPTITKPVQPTDGFATVNGSSIDFGWIPVFVNLEETSYRMQVLSVEDLAVNANPIVNKWYNIGNSHEWQAGALKEGKYFFFLQSLNGLNIWSEVAKFPFIVDKTPPNVPILNVSKRNVVTTADSVLLSWQVSPDTVEVRGNFSWTDANPDGDAFAKLVNEGTGHTITFSEDSNAAQTRYYYSVWAVDVAGNISEPISVDVYYNPLTSSAPTFNNWSGAIVVVNGAETKYFSKEPQLEWSWQQAAGTNSAVYRIAMTYKLGSIAPEPSASDYRDTLLSGESHITGLSDGYYTLYVKQNILGSWTAPVSRTYIVNYNSKPQPPAKIISSKIVGAFPFNGDTMNLRGIPTWSWDMPTDPTGVVGFEYRINKGALQGTWVDYSDLVARSYTEDNGLEPGTYVFEIRSKNMLGKTSNSITFETQVKAYTDLPAAPILVVDGDSEVGGLSAVAKWKWTYPSGKTINKIWAKLGEEPDVDVDAPLATGTTTFHEIYKAIYAGKDINVSLFVKALYNEDISGVDKTYSLSASKPIRMDFAPPIPPIIMGAAETSETKPSWVVTHSNLTDAKKFRYKIGGTPTWTTILSGPSVDVMATVDYPVASNVVLVVQAADKYDNWSESAQFTTKIIEGLDPPVITIADYVSNGNYLNFATKNAKVDISHTTLNTVSAIRYRISNGSTTWRLVNAPAKPYFFNFPDGFLKDTLGTAASLSVQVKVDGEWSKTGVFTLDLIDVTNPAPATNLHLQGNDTRTGDTTPMVEWNGASDVVKYHYTFKNSGGTLWSGYTTSSKFVAPTVLVDGDYTFSVVTYDVANNSSAPTEFAFAVDSTYRDYSRPEIISVIMTERAAVKDYVKVQWLPESKSVKYAVYRLTQEQISADPVTLNGLTPVLDWTNFDTTGNATNGMGFADEKYFFYDNVATADHYYVVVGQNDENKTGFYRIKYNSIQIAEAYGYALNPVSNLKTLGYLTKVSVVWDGYGSNYTYRIVRAGPYSSVPTSIPQTDLKVLSAGNSWNSFSSDDDIINNGLALTATSYDDTTANTDIVSVTSMTVYVYRVYAINTVSKTNASNLSAEFNSLTGLFYMSAPSEMALKLFIPNPDDVVSFTVSDKNYDYMGKILINLVGSNDIVNLSPLFDVKLERTYRYGGGHQGYHCNDRSGSVDFTSHTQLDNPDPATSQWEKSIELEYPIDFVASKNIAIKDTLYDTDSTGEKLIAVRNLNLSRDEGAFLWYERKKSLVDANSFYEPIYDPDGTPSEMEWHYLKWDWVMRKYMYHPNNPKIAEFPNGGNPADGNKWNRIGDRPGRFDLLNATRCDYRVILKYKGPGNLSKSSAPKYGWPALTPREAGSLGMIMREIAFYEVGASYYDEIEESGMGNMPPQNTGSWGGWANSKYGDGGNIQLVSAGLSGLSGVYADLRTNGPGYSFFKDCYLTLNWTGFTMKFGGPHLCMNGHQINFTSPLVSGSVKITAYLYGGQYFHGLQGGSFILVSYGPNSDIRLAVGALSGKNNKNALVTNEYTGGGWQRIYKAGTLQKDYQDRYTSLNWSYDTGGYGSYGGTRKKYPGGWNGNF